MRPTVARAAAWAIVLIGSSMVLASCSLGLVDVVPEPAPAVLSVTSELAPDPEDPSAVRVRVDAALDPGVDLDGEPRRLASSIFEIEGTDYTPLPATSGAPFPSWEASERFPSPGPEGVSLDLPQVAGLGLARSITMRVRVETTPVGTLVLPAGADLVLRTAAPSNPSEAVAWSLEITSASMPSHRVELSGDSAWPTELRVPADRLPDAALPVEASLRIRWSRALDLVDLTPTERYELRLESRMVAEWRVERGS